MITKTRMLAWIKEFRWEDVEAAIGTSPGLLGFRDEKGRNWLHICCSVNVRKRKGKEADSVRTAEVLLNARIDVNEPAFTEGTWKATPLWYAIAFGENLALAEYLLDRGSDPDYCLWAAVNRDSAAAIRLLTGRGAPDPTNADGSPLIAAIHWNKFAAAEELLELGADVNFQDSKKMTALHYVLRKKRDKKYVRLLIAHGARGDIEDGNGVTAAAIMRRKRDPELRVMAARLPE